MAGVASVHARADQTWPSAQAPLDGVLQMRVANLGAWGAWVPPGWRLGGELTTSASLGGRFGAPEFTGQLTGRNLSAHHALLGVQLSDGQVDMVLQGDKARATTPVMLLTALDDRASMRRGMTAGADDYLAKPFTRVELLDALQGLLKKKQRVDETVQTAVSTHEEHSRQTVSASA